MRFILYIFWFIIILIVASFTALNSYSVEVHYYLGTINLYLPLVLIVTLLAGALLGVACMVPPWVRANKKTRKHKHKLKQVEQELNNLRTMPAKEAH